MRAPLNASLAAWRIVTRPDEELIRIESDVTEIVSSRGPIRRHLPEGA